MKLLTTRRFLLRSSLRELSSLVESSTTATSDSRPSRREVLRRQNELFSLRKSKEMSARVPRIEKIEVRYKGRNIADDATILVNKNLSTPNQCAKHISNHIAESSVLALVKKYNTPESQDGVIVAVKTEGEDDETKPSTEISTIVERADGGWIPWDMHRPLETECEMKLLNFAMNLSSPWETQAVNKAYWRSCAMVLAAVAQEAFEEELTVKPAYFPDVEETCGAFCYDIELDKSLLDADGSTKWRADESNLIKLTKTARHLISQNLQFERLDLHKEDALEIFEHNDFLKERIDRSVFTSVSPNRVPVYRFGRYLDVCDGPLIPNTSFMYHFVVTAVHHLRSAEDAGDRIWRFQGLSLPKRLQVHHAVWSMLEHRARKLVMRKLPFKIMKTKHHSVDVPLHKYKSIENETKKFNLATGQWLEDGWEASSQKLEVPT